MEVLFYDRGLTHGFQLPGVGVERLRWSIEGGASEAILRIDSNRVAFEALGMLRCGVEVYEHGIPIWWGYVDAVEAVRGQIALRGDLASMVNRVATSYLYTYMTQQQWFSWRKITSWVEDAASVAEYGKKEKLIELGSVSTAEAEGRRDALLSVAAWPRPVACPSKSDQPGITITCKGWWSTLDWVHWALPAGEGYGVQGRDIQDVGAVYSKVAMSFTASSNYTVDSLAAMVRKVGSPADNTVFSLQADSGGNPSGVDLATGSLALSGMAYDFNWWILPMGTPYAVTSGSTYWMVFSRSGGNDASNFYYLNVNEDCSAAGTFKIYSGSWGARSPNAHPPYQVIAGEETTAQIANLVAASACGQFFTGVLVDQASGLRTMSYRLGTETGLTEARGLLAFGAPGVGPLQAEVTRERILRVYKQPTEAEVTISGKNIKGMVPGAILRVERLAGRLAQVDTEGFGPGILSPGIQTLLITGLEMDREGNIRPV